MARTGPVRARLGSGCRWAASARPSQYPMRQSFSQAARTGRRRGQQAPPDPEPTGRPRQPAPCRRALAPTLDAELEPVAQARVEAAKARTDLTAASECRSQRLREAEEAAPDGARGGRLPRPIQAKPRPPKQSAAARRRERRGRRRPRRPARSAGRGPRPVAQLEVSRRAGPRPAADRGRGRAAGP